MYTLIYCTVCIVLALLMYAYIVRTDKQYQPQHWYERVLDITLLAVAAPAIVMVFVVLLILGAALRLYRVVRRRFTSSMK